MLILIAMSETSNDMRERLVKIETLLLTLNARLDILSARIAKINDLEIEQARQTLLIRVLAGLVLLGGSSVGVAKYLL